MDEEMIVLNRLEEARKEIYYDRIRKCLIPNCSNNAGKNNHVLQKNGVLNRIVDSSNKFYMPTMKSLFNTEESILKIKKVGINEGYTFDGFCTKCDNDFFKEIETFPINLLDNKVQAKFSYRTVCLELRNKEKYLEACQSILAIYKELYPNKIHYINMRPVELAIKNLTFYKEQLELELSSGGIFNHHTIELPFNKVVFSSPLTIHDPNNPKSWEYDEYGYTREGTLVRSVFNYFPYNNNSYLIISMHKDFECNWTKEIISNLSTPSQSNKVISDIITYRLEFWGIASEIYESWSAEKQAKFIYESDINAENYSYHIESDFNLFDN